MPVSLSTLTQSLFDRAVTWIVRGDRGLSSVAIWAHMMGVPYDGGAERRHYPKRIDDFTRCVMLLDQIPEWRERLPELRGYAPGWAGLVDRWPTLEARLREESGGDLTPRLIAPAFGRELGRAVAAGYLADPRYDCALWPDGTLRRAHPRNPKEMGLG